MKLIDAIKQRGRPFEILDCSRDDLLQFFVEMGFKVGAEIGVKKGEFSEKFAKAGLTLYAIDPWKSYKDYEDARLDSFYEYTKRILVSYPNCRITRKTSMETVEDFEDGSLDFVYIDANHQFRHVADDLCEWSKKVRKGGIISGDDFFYTARVASNIIHVPYAVKAFTDAYRAKNWYLLGRKETLPGEQRDRWRSWMFVKDYAEPSPLNTNIILLKIRLYQTSKLL